MSDDRMPRVDGDGPSPLEQLRQIVRANPAEGEFLRAQKKKLKATALIAQIEARHGIHGLNAQRLSDFWRWLLQRETRSAANAAVENLREMAGSSASTPEEVHQWLVDLLQITGLEKKNISLLCFVTAEVRKVMQLAHSREKWQAAQQEKIDAGLQAVFEDIKSDAVAVELFEKIKQRIAAKQ